jgi:ABC-type sulfate transport system substrate-binding protein
MRVTLQRNGENTTLVDVILTDDAGVPIATQIIPRDWVRRLYANAAPFTAQLVDVVPPDPEPAP